jgi:hypothetical protein
MDTMLPLPFFLLLLTCLSGQEAPACQGGSYLYQPAFCMDYCLREPAKPYVPQPGDLFVCTGRELWAKLGHRAARTAAPQHSGIVFAHPDGKLCLLEGGPHNEVHCKGNELLPELESYFGCERIWIRRRRVPLTPEQSERLTCFTLSKEGVRFGLLRMFWQMTPLSCRGPLRTRYLGGPDPDRRSYFCSELVMDACVAAGLLDPATTRPSATYPRDIFFGKSLNPYINKHLDLSDWYAPARWTSCPGHEPALERRFPWLDGDTDR